MGLLHHHSVLYHPHQVLARTLKLRVDRILKAQVRPLLSLSCAAVLHCYSSYFCFHLHYLRCTMLPAKTVDNMALDGVRRTLESIDTILNEGEDETRESALSITRFALL